MADKQISQLPAATQINDEDLLVMQQDSTAKKLPGSVFNEHIDTKTATTRAAIAPTEASTTASQAYAIGERFWLNGTLYIATAAIASGGTIVTSGSGANCKVDVLGDDVSDLKSAVDDLEETLSGGLDNLVVGTSEQLLSKTGETEQVPYNFRTSGGSADIGNRETDMVVGGTIAWNQLAKPINSWSRNFGSATVTISNGEMLIQNAESETYAYEGVQDKNIKSGHVYIALSLVKSNGCSAGVYFRITNTGINYSAVTSNTYTLSAIIQKADGSNASFDYAYQLRIGTGGTESSATFKAPQLFDLTQMFGSTIADHIYALEQANAGAGVAWFKKLFPKDYYAYNAGELMSVNTSAHVTRGFNQWDEEWESGYYNRDTGNKAGSSNTTYFRSKNKIPCLPNTYYYCLLPKTHAQNTTYFAVLRYDANNNYIDSDMVSSYPSRRTLTPRNARYITFYCEVGVSGASYQNDICINIFDQAKNDTYEPYDGHTYPLNSSLTLRGIPKLDSYNNLYYGGDTYESDGTVTRRYGIVDLGTLTWAKESAGIGDVFTATLSDAKPVSSNTETFNGISSALKSVSRATLNSTLDENVIALNTVSTLLVHPTATYADAATFKTAMSGVQLVYELATPTTETATPYQNPQIVSPYGTEEYVDAAYEAGTRDVAVPVGHTTFYHQNLRKKIEDLPSDFSTIIAPTEKTATATRNYAVGEFLILNNVFYRVTSAITTGGTITVGTNVTATTIAEQLLALINS